MKNLIDELNNLDEIKYDISPRFSKNVMKEIYKEKRNGRLIKVTSIASVACVAVISFIIVRNSTLKNNTLQNSSDNIVSSLISSTSGSNVEEKKVSVESEETVMENAILTDETNDSLETPPSALNENASLDTNDVDSARVKEEKQIKSYNYEENVNEITEKLVAHGYIITTQDNIIIVDSNDLDAIKSMLSAYLNITIELENDKIKIDINR